MFVFVFVFWQVGPKLGIQEAIRPGSRPEDKRAGEGLAVDSPNRFHLLNVFMLFSYCFSVFLFFFF